ncbi:MAG: hypothetical protein GXO23_06420 [Crenarchaeota archaeon]|nr:hypothetical protein [Thermoproteota archaeon]
MIEEEKTDIILLCIIRAIHRVATPEAMILIVRAAAQEFINYLTSENIINNNDDIMKNLQKIIETLRNYNIISNIKISKTEKNITVRGTCSFFRLCKCVDKVLRKRDDLRLLFRDRPCAIAMILESYVDEQEIQCDIYVTCEEGAFEISVEGLGGGPAGI